MTRTRVQDRLTAESRQMRQLLDDLCRGLDPWVPLISPRFLDTIGTNPRSSDLGDTATQRRIRILRAIVERAERLGLSRTEPVEREHGS